jgi:hypothetical protein
MSTRATDEDDLGSGIVGSNSSSTHSGLYLFDDENAFTANVSKCEAKIKAFSVIVLVGQSSDNGGTYPHVSLVSAGCSE